MKKIILLLVLFLMTVTMVGCGSAKLLPEQKALMNSKDIIYTQVPMWLEGNRVHGLNTSKGLLIPINSQVNILKVNKKVIVLSYLGTTIKYLIARKYTRIDTDRMLARSFSKTPLNISKYTLDIQQNILDAKVVIGMTKEEVLLARGYPPSHRTPSLDVNEWKYWDNRGKTAKYKFEDDKVVEVIMARS